MADIALQVENLVKVYQPRRTSPVRAVDGMSFGVGRGQIFGLLGPNGAGKTTILKVLTTLIQATSGRAEVMGFDVVRHPLDVRRRISVVLQESAVEMFRDSVTPALREQDGFEGVYVLLSPDGKALVVTFWATDEAAEAGIAGGRSFYAEQIEKFVTIYRSPPGRETYDVILAEAPALTIG